MEAVYKACGTSDLWATLAHVVVGPLVSHKAVETYKELK